MNRFWSFENLLKPQIYAIAIAVNMLSTTLLMIFLSFLGFMELAADVGLIQGATLTVFLAFSANARNLILGRQSAFHLKQQFIFRGILLLPLVFTAFQLSHGIIETSGMLAVAIILRRSLEWIAELQINEREKAKDTGYGNRFVGTQLFSFCLLISSFTLGNEHFYTFALFFWACSPVFQIIPFLARMVPQCMERVKIDLGNFLPHVGSSWIIAFSTFVFRILLALLVGKSVAGLLFSAFAIGGMLNAIYAYAIGPSLISRQENHADNATDKIINLTALAHCLVGFAILALAAIGGVKGSESIFFMQAIGFSVIGGGIMILANRRRMHILQIQKDNVFVPDLLANVLIISTVPFAFYSLGPDILGALFLWNACLTYILYTLPAMTDKALTEEYSPGMSPLSGKLSHPKTQACVLGFLVLPVFFQLKGNFIFNDPTMVFDSKGILNQIPLPISVIACFLGIALLNRFKETQLSAGVLFGLFNAMLFSVFILSMGNRVAELEKFLLLIQFILPVFALLLGQSYIAPEHPKLRLEAICLYILAFVIPLEVLATLIQGTGYLTPHLYVFTLYQHLQYLPVIFVGLYFLALTSLYEHREMRTLFLFLSPFFGIYTVASGSNLALALLLAGVCGGFWILRRSGHGRFAILLVILIITSMLAYGAESNSNDLFRHKFGWGIETAAPPNIHQPWQSWKLYWDGVIDNGVNFIYGHQQILNRNLATSAHNYYLDLVYNFGFISLLPFIFLIGYTANKLYRVARTTILSPELIGLASLVLFFVLVDNSLKVSFRQPYPGIIMFFLWGVLLSRLTSLENKKEELDIVR